MEQDIAALNKVIIETSETIPNTIDVVLNNEGHTSASVIVERLEKTTEFSAYKIDHPTDTFVKLRVTSDGENRPIAVLKNCVKDIVKDIDDVISQVEKGF